MKKGRILLGVAALLLLILIGTVYKILGPLGNAFIIAVVILAIILALWEVFQGLKARKPVWPLWPHILVGGGLLILVAAWIVVEFAHQFWGFYLGLVGAAVGYIGARLYLEKEKGGTKKTKK